MLNEVKKQETSKTRKVIGLFKKVPSQYVSEYEEKPAAEPANDYKTPLFGKKLIKQAQEEQGTKQPKRWDRAAQLTVKSFGDMGRLRGL